MEKLYNKQGFTKEQMVDELLNKKDVEYSHENVDLSRIRSKYRHDILMELNNRVGSLNGSFIHAYSMYEPYEIVSIFIEILLENRLLLNSIEEHRDFIKGCFDNLDKLPTWRRGNRLRISSYLKEKHKELQDLNKDIGHVDISSSQLVSFYEDLISNAHERMVENGVVRILLNRKGRYSTITVQFESDTEIETFIHQKVYIYNKNRIYLNVLYNAYDIYLKYPATLA